MENSISHTTPTTPAKSSALSRNINIDFRKPATVLLFAWIIFIAALGLRVVGLGEYPARHATDDEFGFLWGGLNFWDSGMPASWSSLQGGVALRQGEATIDGRGYIIVAPYLDHPPLFTLLSGGFAKFTGPQRIDQITPEGNPVTIWDVDLARARWLMIGIFAVTFWILYGLARLTWPPPVALLTVLFYGFMSHAVAHGRLILADNLSALVLVANAFVIQRWLTGRGTRRQMIGWTISLTAAAVLTKIPAWCHIPAMIALFVTARRAREMRYVFYGFGVGISIYLAWLAYYGLPEFISVMSSQTSRFRGFNAFQLMSGVPRLLHERDLNGLVIAGWFCLVVQALRPGASPLTVIGAVYAMAFTFFAGDVLFGWYSAPLFPWLALALGLTTVQVWQRPTGPMMIAWLLLFLPHAFQTLYIAHYELEQVLRYIFAAVVAGLLFTMALPRPRAQSILRMAIIAILAVVLMRETYEVTNQRTDRISDQEKYLR